MTEAAKVRDWLSELRGAAEDDNSDLFRSLVAMIATVQPDLKEPVCQLAGEYLENGEAWAADFFKNPSVQPKRVEAPEHTEPKIADSRTASWRRHGARVAPATKEVTKEAIKLAAAPLTNILDAVRRPKIIAPLPLQSWSGLTIPPTANELEALTYVPGLVGEITEWIVSGAKRPNRVMALGVASVVVGTLIGRHIEGPTGSATHLYLIILAPTGYGKDWPLQCGTKLMDAVGASDLLGPSEWASAPGFERRLARNPLMACFMDELGDELSLVNNHNSNAWVSKIIGTLKKCYNAWGIVITAEKVKEESEKITWPAPSIVGAATPESFFSALQPRDLESGFANRLVILPFEGSRRPPEQATSPKADQPPKELIEMLKRLPRQPGILDKPPNGPPTRKRVEWSAGAEDVYIAFSKKMDDFEGSDRKRYELGMRACENATRWATNVAVGRGSPTVDKEDIAWAIAWTELSIEAACGGFERYMREYFEFPKMCDIVGEAICFATTHNASKQMSTHDIYHRFGRNQRWGNELDKVIAHLLKAGRIERSSYNPPLGGRTSEGFKWIGEG